MRRIEPPLMGSWPFGECPAVVLLTLPGGVATFRLARLSENRPGVLAQYREARPEHSMHLRLLDSLEWIVDHTDRWNPDFGIFYAIAHGIVDHPIGRLFWRRGARDRE